MEEEACTGQPLAGPLAAEGFGVVVAADRAGLREWLAHRDPDLVLLELLCPGRDGAELCRWIRDRSDVPVILVAAQEDESALIRALVAGADDYLTMPFSLQELTARIRAVLRRSAPPEILLPDTMEAGDVRIDLTRHRLTVRGQPAALPLFLFTLLVTLMRNRGRVVSREELRDQLGLSDTSNNPRTINTYIRRIRAVIEADPARPRHVKTIRGRGYIFDP
ncbi:winged helix-turn-helix domain-containing protein [Citricoccus sp. SGAir0253]|uniref:winged helix-turn-helix domain-containing protein n=1 Tax=Citricoccus sp. SGAir0253 TaxID=2567881 RepID=UPI00143D6CE1|nr:response regulator transcription factor [Citricoccus sp. SGAir0253]